MLESDLRLLSGEARKLETLAHQITGLFSHSDAPNIKDSCEKALQRLRAISGPGARVRGMEAVQASPVGAGSLGRSCWCLCHAALSTRATCSGILQLPTASDAATLRRKMCPVCAMQDLLRPFLQACEYKNGKLVTVALSSFQKFVANKGVGPEGRSEIVKALNMVRGVHNGVQQQLNDMGCGHGKRRALQHKQQILAADAADAGTVWEAKALRVAASSQ